MKKLIENKKTGKLVLMKQRAILHELPVNSRRILSTRTLLRISKDVILDEPALQRDRRRLAELRRIGIFY